VAASFQLAGAATGAARPKDGCPLVVPLSSNRHDVPRLHGTITQAEGGEAGYGSSLLSRSRYWSAAHLQSWRDEAEVLQVLRKPGPVYRGERNSRMKSGQTEAGRCIQVVYSPDPVGAGIFVITAYPLKGKALKAYRRRQRRK
jgi:hypothetical protein